MGWGATACSGFRAIGRAVGGRAFGRGRQVGGLGGVLAHGHVPLRGSRACARLIVRWRRGPTSSCPRACSSKVEHGKAVARLDEKVGKLERAARDVLGVQAAQQIGGLHHPRERLLFIRLRHGEGWPDEPAIISSNGVPPGSHDARVRPRPPPRDVAAPVSASCHASYTCATPGMRFSTTASGSTNAGCGRLPPGGCTPGGGRTSPASQPALDAVDVARHGAIGAARPAALVSLVVGHTVDVRVVHHTDEGSNVVSFVNQLTLGQEATAGRLRPRAAS